MNKRFFASLLLLCCSLTAAAQQTLNIHTTTQGVVSFAFDEQPDMTFPSTDLLRVTSTSLTIEFPFAEVQKITFQNTTDAVESLTVHDGNDAVLIYDLSGKLLRQSSATQGTATVDLSTLRPGVYVVRDGKRTYKVTKR